MCTPTSVTKMKSQAEVAKGLSTIYYIPRPTIDLKSEFQLMIRKYELDNAVDVGRSVEHAPQSTTLSNGACIFMTARADDMNSQ